MSKSEELRLLKSLVPLLQEALGPFYEVVLHDFSDLQHSIVAIAGNITGRRIGGSVTNVVLSALKANKIEHMLGYPTSLPDGRLLRSSTIFIKDKNDKVVGCLCINLDLTPFVGAEKTLTEFTETYNSGNSQANEDFPTDVADLVGYMLQRALARIPKPVAQMTREDKIQIVQELDKEGLFLIKGAVDAVANVLCLSRATVYNYISQVRGEYLLSGVREEERSRIVGRHGGSQSDT